ncbi:hypothetical protein [Brevibacillus centrosporus]|uniref:hypothetical protein n=1 Tax=Brevibacillus centrosporus TaxID=54910 RepID=UPI003B01C796
MEDFKKVLDKVLKYWLLLPVVIYITGYIYAQGILSFVSLKFLSLDPFGMTASTEFYIRNGISFFVSLIVPIVVSVAIFEIIKPRLKLKKYNLSYIFILLITQLVCWCIHFWVSTICKENVITYETYELFYNCYSFVYYTITLTVFIIAFYCLSELSKEERVIGFISDSHDNKKFKQTKATIYMYHAFLMGFSLIMSVYLSGLFKHDNLIKSALNNSGGKITYADVQTEDITKRYLYFDVVNNNFIGFDLNYSNKSSSSVIIPITKVKKIDVVELSSPLKVKVLSNNEDVLEKNKIIEKFYSSYKQKDANTFINTISRNAYKEPPYSLIPAKELINIWNKNENYNSFIPLYFQVFESVEDKQSNSSLYVIEYYESKIKYLEYKFIWENNQYKIDEISEVKQWFNIQE